MIRSQTAIVSKLSSGIALTSFKAGMERKNESRNNNDLKGLSTDEGAQVQPAKLDGPNLVCPNC